MSEGGRGAIERTNCLVQRLALRAGVGDAGELVALRRQEGAERSEGRDKGEGERRKGRKGSGELTLLSPLATASTGPSSRLGLSMEREAEEREMGRRKV